MRPGLLGNPSLLLLLPLQSWNDVSIEHMTEGTVAKVMHETCNSDITDLPGGDVVLGVILLENLHLKPSQVGRSDAVLETLVRARREHLVRAPKLLQVLQPLEDGRVDNLPTTFLQDKDGVRGETV